MPKRYRQWLICDNTLLPRSTRSRWRLLSGNNHENVGQNEQEVNSTRTNEDRRNVPINLENYDMNRVLSGSGSEDLQVPSIDLENNDMHGALPDSDYENENNFSDLESITYSDSGSIETFTTIDEEQCVSNISDSDTDIHTQDIGDSDSDNNFDSEHECNIDNTDDTENCDNQYFISGGHDQIYPGAGLTKNQSLLLFMSYVQKHHVTDVQLEDFLNIMNLMLPDVFPTSKYLFYKKFHYREFTRHYFCNDCHCYFGTTANGESCSCATQNTIDSAKQGGWYFTYQSLKSQLRLLLSSPEIQNALAKEREKDACSPNISDAVNGEIYNHLSVHGYDRQTDISLLWNVDGVPVFRYIAYHVFLHTPFCSAYIPFTKH